MEQSPNYSVIYPGNEEEFYQMLEYFDSIKSAKDLEKSIVLSFVDELRMPENQVKIVKVLFSKQKNNFEEFYLQLGTVLDDMVNNHLNGWNPQAYASVEKKKPVPKKNKKVVMFICNECGHRFYTTKAAENAQWHGCPGCHGSDIDAAC